MTERPVRARTPLPGISSRAWEHPADKGALVALRKLRGFDTVLKALSGLFNERAVRLLFLGSAIRVDERQFARLHRLLTDVGATLDAPELPEMYVVANPYLNAVTIGMNKPIIVLNSAPGRPARRGGAALRDRPRARPRAQRARGLPDAAAAAARAQRRARRRSRSAGSGSA